MKQNIYVRICGLNVAIRNRAVDRYVPLTWKGTKIYDFYFCLKRRLWIRGRAERTLKPIASGARADKPRSLWPGFSGCTDPLFLLLHWLFISTFPFYNASIKKKKKKKNEKKLKCTNHTPHKKNLSQTRSDLWQVSCLIWDWNLCNLISPPGSNGFKRCHDAFTLEVRIQTIMDRHRFIKSVEWYGMWSLVSSRLRSGFCSFISCTTLSKLHNFSVFQIIYLSN